MLCLLMMVQTLSQGGGELPAPGFQKPGPLPLSAAVYPHGVTTESDYLGTLAVEQEALLRKTGQADAAAVPRWQAHHGAWLLAIRCEPPLTRLILDIPEPSDLTTLADTSRQALELLEKAEASWPQEEAIEREQLELFINLARAGTLLAQSRQASPDPQAISRVANELAVWVDDDNPEVSSAALLWAGLLYDEAGQTERALQLLPMALQPVDGRVGDFYLRLLRCVLLAKKGRTTLALALLLKMEERCERWLAGEALQNSALCTLAWLRARITSENMSTVGELTRQSMSEWLQRAREIYHNPDSPCTLIRLRQSAPMLFPSPQSNP